MHRLLKDAIVWLAEQQNKNSDFSSIEKFDVISKPVWSATIAIVPPSMVQTGYSTPTRGISVYTTRPSHS